MALLRGYVKAGCIVRRVRKVPAHCGTCCNVERRWAREKSIAEVGRGVRGNLSQRLTLAQNVLHLFAPRLFFNVASRGEACPTVS